MNETPNTIPADYDWIAYDGAADQDVDLRTCTPTELREWVDASRIAGDTLTEGAALTLLDSDHDLMDADTAERIRYATPAEFAASKVQAERDGGAGIIAVDGRRCYVIGD